MGRNRSASLRGRGSAAGEHLRELGEGELIAHCRDYLAGYKKPSAIVMVAELPRNAGGKVLKRRLRETYGPAAVPAAGPIPAHLLGNLWAQEWGNIYPLVVKPGAEEKCKEFTTGGTEEDRREHRLDVCVLKLFHPPQLQSCDSDFTKEKRNVCIH